jgi:hypothetical protein
MSLTQLETRLRLVARERIEKGKLPSAVPSRMWGGRGGGKPCALCDTVIKREETELEVEERLGGKVETFHFHILCQSLWQLECVRDYHLKQKLKT